SGLIDGDLAATQPFDLALIDIDAGYVVAALGQAGPRDEAHVPGADHRNVHYVTPRFPDTTSPSNEILIHSRSLKTPLSMSFAGQIFNQPVSTAKPDLPLVFSRPVRGARVNARASAAQHPATLQLPPAARGPERRACPPHPGE